MRSAKSRKFLKTQRSFLKPLLIICCLILNSAVQADENPNVVNMAIAATPAEFRCEALDSSTFDQVNESMESLKQTLNETFGINDSCVTTKLSTPENQKNLSKLIDNVKGGVTTIRGQLANAYIENLANISSGSATTQQAYEITAQGQEKAKEAVVTVVGAMKELNAIIAKNPLNISSSQSCKSHYSSSERFVFGVAELVEDISPLLIQAVSKIPGLQELAPAVIAATMASSAVTHYAEVAQKRVDINKPENRKAILINTCQIAKTYNRMKMLRGLKDNSMEEKQKLKKMISEQTSIVHQTVNLQKNGMTDGKSESQWISGVEQQDRNFHSLTVMKETMTRENLASVCESKNKVNELTASILATHRTISQLSRQQKSLDEDILTEQITRYLKNSGLDSTENCARKARTLFEYASSMNQRTFQILMGFKMTRMAKNPQFIKATAHLDYLRSFQDVLETMNTDNLFEKLQFSIDKTESLQIQSRVLKAWFGNAKTFYSPFDDYRNPVMDLMNHYERQFLAFRKSYMIESSKFEYNLYQLYTFWHPRKPKQSEEDHVKDFNSYVRGTLNILTPTYLDSKNPGSVSGRSSPHEKACTGLITIRNNYRTMIDSWNTLKYFCQMLKPLLLEPAISKTLKDRCMAQDDLVPDSPRAKLSGVDQLLGPVHRDVQRMPVVIDKIQELNCEN